MIFSYFRIEWQMFQANVNISNGLEILTNMDLAAIAPLTYNTSQVYVY
jgi:hypothetical protein